MITPFHLKLQKPTTSIFSADGGLHHGSCVHLVRKQAQLEGVQKLAFQNDVHGRAQGA